MTAFSKTILLVEDNEDDVFLFKHAFRRAKITAPLQYAADGQKAMDYLAGRGPFADRNLYPLPDLVFLDLKLPYVHGFEVFAWIRQQPQFTNFTVVILTSSPEPSDQERAVQLGAFAYLVKPPSPELLTTILSACELTPQQIFQSPSSPSGPPVEH